MSYSIHFLRQGRTHDHECSRSSARLSLSMRILKAEGLDPTDRVRCTDEAILAAASCADTLIRERVKAASRAYREEAARLAQHNVEQGQGGTQW